MENQPLPGFRSDLQFIVHTQGNNLWYAVQDPGSERFLKIGRLEYLIACALNGTRSCSDIIEFVQSIDSSQQPTESDVIQLVEWLGKNQLLASSTDTPTPARAEKPVPLPNPLYTRVPLVQGRHLEKVSALFLPWVSGLLIAIVSILTVVAAIAVIANWEEFQIRASKLFVADGRLWWIVAWLVLKAAHESGHAIAATRIGCHIRSAGISFICFAPVPYVDISDLWTISNRWHRILCCSAGMLVEIGLASVAALIALTTSSQSLQYFCCTIATLGTATTLAFNANPLVRFDGYFIFSDLLNRPNLWTEANLAAKQFAAKIANPLQPVKQKMTVGLVAYGLFSFQYRVVLLGSLALWALIVWQGLGVILVLWGAYGVVLAPLLKKYQFKQAASKAGQTSPATPLDRYSKRLGWAIMGSCVALLFIVPSPIQPTAPAVVTLREPVTVRGNTEGFLSQVLVDADQVLTEGQLIAVLENPQLALDLAIKANEMLAAEESIRSMRARGDLAQLQAEQAKLHSLEAQYAQLQTQVAALEVCAPSAGRVVKCGLKRQMGRYFSDGEPLCIVARQDGLELTASVGQDALAAMRAACGDSLSVRLSSGERFTGVIEKIETRGSRELREPSLAAMYGGPLAVELEQGSNGDETLLLLEPRFDVHIRLGEQECQNLVPGQIASIRIPGSSANLWNGISRWLEGKWKSLLYNANKATSAS